MSLMSKLLISAVVASVALSANSQPNNKDLVNYVKRAVVKNPRVKVKGVEVIESKTNKDLPGWNILLTNMDLMYHKKELHIPETMFIKDGLITNNLINLKTGENYRETIRPSVPDSMYNDAHLLFGNKDAKHKVLVFSDPECPFCRDIMPSLMKAVKENPSKLALYYYHMPLVRIHPASSILTRVMHLAQEAGKKDVVEKMYSIRVSPRDTNVTSVLAKVKSYTGFSVTKKDIEKKEVKDAIKADMDMASKMMISGTPTVYVDGKWDKKRNGYKALIK